MCTYVCIYNTHVYMYIYIRASGEQSVALIRIFNLFFVRRHLFGTSTTTSVHFKMIH